jgi:hypothetical protein
VVSAGAAGKRIGSHVADEGVIAGASLKTPSNKILSLPAPP